MEAMASPLFSHSLYTHARQNQGTVKKFEVAGKEYELFGDEKFTWFYTPLGMQYVKDRLMTSTGEAPNWTLYFSVQPDDLREAFDIVVQLFVTYRCKTVLRAAPHFRGKELSLVVYQESQLSSSFPLSQHYSFWPVFIGKVDEEFHARRIRSNGIPVENKLLGFCVYASLRNEAYVNGKPPTSGWNAALHRLPVALSHFVE